MEGDCPRDHITHQASHSTYNDLEEVKSFGLLKSAADAYMIVSHADLGNIGCHFDRKSQ